MPNQLKKSIRDLGDRSPFKGKEYMFEFMDNTMPLAYQLVKLDQLVQKWISAIRLFYIVKYVEGVT